MGVSMRLVELIENDGGLKVMDWCGFEVKEVKISENDFDGIVKKIYWWNLVGLDGTFQYVSVLKKQFW